jgi:sigma-B regulation protein RsbU (phosphoserine phosphatase)
MFEKTKFIPVGLFEDFEYGEASLQFGQGDKLYLYTDGVSEAENADYKLFGDDNLLKIIRENRMDTPRDLIHKMEEGLALHVNGHTQSDDITMMTIVYNGESIT